jgi:hypothetical protein
MPTSILSSLLSKASLSIVNSQTGIDAATNLSVSRVGFKFRARAMRHMREDGTSIVDARILLPTTVEIDVLAPTLDALSGLNSVMVDRTGVNTITSKGLVLTNMMAEDQMIRQTPEIISANPVRIVFKQVLTQNNSAPPAVEQAPDSSLLDKGIQSVGAAVQTVQGLANSVVSTVQDLAQEVINLTGL